MTKIPQLISGYFAVDRKAMVLAWAVNELHVGYPEIFPQTLQQYAIVGNEAYLMRRRRFASALSGHYITLALAVKCFV